MINTWGGKEVCLQSSPSKILIRQLLPIYILPWQTFHSLYNLWKTKNRSLSSIAKSRSHFALFSLGECICLFRRFDSWAAPGWKHYHQHWRPLWPVTGKPSCDRTAARNYRYPLLDFLAGVHRSSAYWEQRWARGRSPSSKCRACGYRPRGHFEPWSNGTVLFACTPALSTLAEMSHLAGGFLCVNLGCPVALLPLLFCQPGFLLKHLLKVWTHLEGGLSPFPTCYRPHISKHKRGGWFGPWPPPTATASGNHRRCFQLCCLHSSSNKWAGFLPHSRGCLFVRTTTRGPSFCHHLVLAVPLWL